MKFINDFFKEAICGKPSTFASYQNHYQGNMYVYFLKLVTVVEGNPEAPFLIATTPLCKGGRYSFPWIAPLHPWYVPYNAEC